MGVTKTDQRPAVISHEIQCSFHKNIQIHVFHLAEPISWVKLAVHRKEVVRCEMLMLMVNVPLANLQFLGLKCGKCCK